MTIAIPYLQNGTGFVRAQDFTLLVLNKTPIISINVPRLPQRVRSSAILAPIPPYSSSPTSNEAAWTLPLRGTSTVLEREAMVGRE